MAQVKGIMFMSTPQRGTQYASTLNNLLSISGVAQKMFVSELDNNSTTIQDLNSEFRLFGEHLRIATLFETLPTKVGPGKKKQVRF